MTMESANIHSISVIRNELNTTIDQAARDLELFVSDGGDPKQFQSCLLAVRQISGILKVLELKGGSLLADELYATSSLLGVNQQGPTFEKLVDVISNTFYILNRYLEYVQQTERKLPVLLIPYLNELRKVRKDPVLPESFFFTVNINAYPPLPECDPIEVTDQEFMPLLTRLRHMYQLGLLGILRDRQVNASLGLIKRALTRLQRLGPDKPLSTLWWMATLAVDVLLTCDMELLESRKTLLSRIDRIIRQVQKSGRIAYEAVAPKGLFKELLYMVALSGSETESIKQLKEYYGIKPFPYNDKFLSVERNALRGPSVQTIASLVRVLRIEMENVKKVLESAASSGQVLDDVEGLKESLNKIAETMAVVGLVGPSSILKSDLKRIEHWRNDQLISLEDLNESARVFLYLDSALTAFEQDKISPELLSGTNQLSQQQMIVLSELGVAEKYVLHECIAGMSLIKRSITAYSESNFEPGHVINLSKTLKSIWGALIMVGRPKAASIVDRCVQFVDKVLLSQHQSTLLKELLETFADALISVEYYFDTAPTLSKLDDSVLQVAEESLIALGLPVRKS